MSVDGRDGRIIRNRGVVGSNPGHLALLLMCLVNRHESRAIASLQQQPQVGKSGQARARDVGQVPALQVGDEVVEGQEGQQGVGPVDGGN